jgi:hypothetical protein
VEHPFAPTRQDLNAWANGAPLPKVRRRCAWCRHSAPATAESRAALGQARTGTLTREREPTGVVRVRCTRPSLEFLGGSHPRVAWHRTGRLHRPTTRANAAAPWRGGLQVVPRGTSCRSSRRGRPRERTWLAPQRPGAVPGQTERLVLRPDPRRNRAIAKEPQRLRLRRTPACVILSGCVSSHFPP